MIFTKLVSEMHFSGELSTPFSGFGDRKSESQTVLIPESVKMMLLLYLEYQIMKFLQFGLDFYYLYFFYSDKSVVGSWGLCADATIRLR